MVRSSNNASEGEGLRMTKVFFSDLPDRACLQFTETFDPPQSDGETLIPSSGTFKILIENQPITKDTNVKGLKIQFIGENGRWMLERCTKGKNDDAVELVGLKKVRFGAQQYGARLFLNIESYPKVHLRHEEGIAGTYIVIRACAIDIANDSQSPEFVRKITVGGILWKYAIKPHPDELLTEFGLNYDPPGKWPGKSWSKAKKWPFIAGNREKDTLRIELGKTEKDDFGPSDRKWFRMSYPCDTELALYRKFTLSYTFSAAESAAKLDFPGAKNFTHINCDYLIPSKDILGWIETSERRKARPTSLTVGAQWIRADFSTRRSAQLYVAGEGEGAKRGTAPLQIAGSGRNLLAFLELIKSNKDDGQVIFAWLDSGSDDGRRRPYDGLAIAGLSSRLGYLTRFDCTAAVLVYSRNGKSATFASGGDIRGNWTTVLPPNVDVSNTRLQVKRNSNGKRLADVVAGDTAFFVLDNESATEEGKFQIRLNLERKTQSGEFHLPVAKVSAAPLDMLAENETGEYTYWEQIHEEGLQYIAFPLERNAARMPPQLLHKLTTQKPSFRIASNSGRKVNMASGGVTSSLVLREPKKPDEFEKLVYSDIGIGLYTDSDSDRLRNDEGGHKTVSPKEIPIVRTPDNEEAITQNDGVGQLRYVASNAKLQNKFHIEAVRVVSTAIGTADHKNVASVTLDVKSGFGMALARAVVVDKDSEVRQLMYWDTPSFDPKNPEILKPVLMIDADAYNYGASNLRDVLGFSHSQWDGLVRKFKDQGILVKGGPTTPLDPEFQGHILRDFAFAFPGKYRDKLEEWPYLQGLYDRLQSSVIIELAWHDGSGWTLYGRDPHTAFPLVELGVLEVWINEFDVWMRGGKLLSAKGEMELLLPFLEHEDDPKEPKSYKMVFDTKPKSTLLTFDFATIELKGTTTEVNFRGQPFGLKKIEILGGGTDLKSVKLKARLWFNESVECLRDLGVLVDISIPLGKDTPVWIEAQIKDVAEVDMDGWSLKLSAVSFKLGSDQENKTIIASTKVHGVLSLGVDGFLAVRFEITLDSDKGFVFAITGYEGRLTIGDFSAKLELISGEYEYKDPSGNKKKATHFTGDLILKSPLTDELLLKGRIWRGEDEPEVSWAAILGRKQVEGKNFILENGTLMLGRRVKKDQDSDNTLLSALENPSASNVKEAINNVSVWVPDMAVDLVIGAYGNFGLDGNWFSPTSKDTDTGSDRKTGIMLSSGGLFQISASSKFLNIRAVEYDLTLNADKKWVFAGFQVPKFDPLKNHGESDFGVSGGYVGLGLSYDPDNWAFGLTVGWPYSSFLDPDVGAPDWSRAVTVKWQGAFPLNTFAGGVSLYIAGRGEHTDILSFGLALRAGWTWSYSASAWKLTAEAELGIMVGGVLHFVTGNSRYIPAPSSLAYSILYDTAELIPANISKGSLAQTERAALEIAADFVEMIDEVFADLSQLANYTVKCGLFLDAWGGARVKFFGVTLVGVRIDAHAQVILIYSDGKVEKAYAKAHFSVRLKIGCTTYSTQASFKIDFAGKGVGRSALPWMIPPPPPPAALTAPAGSSTTFEGELL